MFVMAVDDNKVAITNPDNEWITSGSVKTNFVRFNFSEAWAGLKKTVIFQTEHCLIPILLEGDELTKEVAIPWECMVFVNDEIRVGAMGTREDDVDTEGDEEIVLPTVWGVLPEKVRQGVVVGEPIEVDPTYNAYLALLKAIEDLIKNGVGGGGGTGGTYDHRDLTNRDAADQHPVDSITGLAAFLTPMTDEEVLAIINRLKGGSAQNGSSD